MAPDVPVPFPSGASVHVTELASNLAKLGHDIHVIARRVTRVEKSIEKTDGYTVHRVYRWMAYPQRNPPVPSGEESRRSALQRIYYLYLRSVFAFYVSLVASRVIRANGLQAVIERESAFGAGGLASAITGRPLLLELIGPRYSRASVRRSSKILYYTDSMLKDWVDRGKCQAVPAGVNTELFRPDPEQRRALRSRQGLSKEDFVVGYVGSFQSWHGVGTLLEAASKLRSRHPNLRILLVGPSFERYEAVAASLGLGAICKFIGPVSYETIPAYVNACDVTVAPYDPSRDALRAKYGIGWPLKVLEYMACGKPVVSTRVPPVDRVIRDRENGLLVDPGNAEELATAVSRLISDPGLSELFSSRGKSLVERSYSWSSVAALFSKAVEEAATRW